MRISTMQIQSQGPGTLPLERAYVFRAVESSTFDVFKRCQLLLKVFTWTVLFAGWLIWRNSCNRLRLQWRCSSFMPSSWLLAAVMEPSKTLQNYGKSWRLSAAQILFRASVYAELSSFLAHSTQYQCITYFTMSIHKMELYRVLYFCRLEHIQQVEIAEMSGRGLTRVIDGGMVRWYHWRCLICKLPDCLLLCCVHPWISWEPWRVPSTRSQRQVLGIHPWINQLRKLFDLYRVLLHRQCVRVLSKTR